jgi:hypothetical protein
MKRKREGEYKICGNIQEMKIVEARMVSGMKI